MLVVIFLSAALCAAALPSIFILIRESTKVHRQGIVQDLIKVFERPGKPGTSTIPSFEFVKYKYFVGDGAADQEGRRRDDFRIHHWILSALPLVAISSC